MKFLKIVVSLDELSEEALYLAVAWARQCNVEFFTLSQCKSVSAENG